MRVFNHSATINSPFNCEEVFLSAARQALALMYLFIPTVFSKLVLTLMPMMVQIIFHWDIPMLFIIWRRVYE